jgi:ATP-dependent helicase/DNAse subunit B
MRIESVSPSSYKKYHFCQFAWFLNYELGFKDQAGAAAMLGSIAHDAMEEATQEKIEGKPQTPYWELWEKHLDLYKSKEPEIFSSIKPAKEREVKKAMETLLSHDRYSPYGNLCVPISAEERLDVIFDEESVVITGKIDRIQEHPEGIEIFDLKTGQQKCFETQVPIDENYLWKDIQLQVYSLFARKYYPQYERVFATLFYVKGEGPLTIEVSKIPEEDIEKRLRDYIKRVKKNEMPQRNKGWHCNVLCHYGKTGICNDVYADIKIEGMDFTKEFYKTVNGKEL